MCGSCLQSQHGAKAPRKECTVNIMEISRIVVVHVKFNNKSANILSISHSSRSISFLKKKGLNDIVLKDIYTLLTIQKTYFFFFTFLLFLLTKNLFSVLN